MREWNTRSFETIAAVNEYVRTLTESEWWKANFKFCTWVKVASKAGRGATGQHFDWQNYGQINLPNTTWGRSWLTVVHELAHAVTPNRDARGARIAAHGREWRVNMLKLTDHVMGADTGRALRAAYRERGVAYLPKRVISPERRAELQARGRALAAKTGPPVRKTATPPCDDCRTGRHVNYFHPGEQ